MQRPVTTRYPDKRIAHLPGYTGPFRRAEDKTYLDKRQKAHERGLLILRIAMWSVGGAVLVLATYMLSYLASR